MRASAGGESSANRDGVFDGDDAVDGSEPADATRPAEPSLEPRRRAIRMRLRPWSGHSPRRPPQRLRGRKASPGAPMRRPGVTAPVPTAAGREEFARRADADVFDALERAFAAEARAAGLQGPGPTAGTGSRAGVAADGDATREDDTASAFDALERAFAAVARAAGLPAVGDRLNGDCVAGGAGGSTDPAEDPFAMLERAFASQARRSRQEADGNAPPDPLPPQQPPAAFGRAAVEASDWCTRGTGARSTTKRSLALLARTATESTGSCAERRSTGNELREPSRNAWLQPSGTSTTKHERASPECGDGGEAEERGRPKPRGTPDPCRDAEDSAGTPPTPKRALRPGATG